MKKNILKFLFLIIALLVAHSTASACSCAARPTVLDSFEASDLVVTTRLVAVDKIREKTQKYEIDHIRSVSMIVSKVYKGNVKPGQVLKFAQGGGADCIWTFDEEDLNREYLFYLGQPTKGHPFFPDENSAEEPMYRAVTCGRSNSIRGAIDDLAYLDKLPKVHGKTRLSGRFDTWFSEEPVGAGLKVKIVGKSKTYQTKTDAKGFFEIYDLPPGDYEVIPEMPFGWKINDYMLGQTSTGFERYREPELTKKGSIPVRIAEKRHSALDLIFDIDTAIKGRVISPAGKPMRNVCVKAVATDLKEGDFRGRSDCTNERGEFLIDEMAGGNYILVVNDDGQMDGDEPFGVLFYPGVQEYKNAGIITVEPGKYVTGRDIHVSQTAELIEIKGRFVFSDGRPVRDERVKFIPSDGKRFDEMNQEPDDNGDFVLRVPKGAAGKLFGEMYTYIGEYEKCAEMEKLIHETGRTNHTFTTSMIEFDGSNPPDPVVLTLPFRSCEKANN